MLEGVFSFWERVCSALRGTNIPGSQVPVQEEDAKEESHGKGLQGRGLLVDFVLQPGPLPVLAGADLNNLFQSHYMFAMNE